MNKLFFLLILYPILSIGKTTVEIDTPPIPTTVICNNEVIGKVPIKFELDNGLYNCSLQHKHIENINFDLKVDNDESIRILKILTIGKMTDAQRQVSIQRVKRQKIKLPEK